MVSESWPGSPASAIVGTSGRAGERLALVTASARNMPSFTWGAAGGRAVKAIGTWPPTAA
jgi:hypothetical protein